MQTPKSQPLNIQAQARFLKLLFFVMVFSVGMDAGVLQLIGQRADHSPDAFRMGLEVLALASALVVLFVRFVMIAGVLVPDAPIPVAERMAKLRTYFIVCYVFSETVALYGFVGRYMGGSLVESAPFFAGSLILYALCYPRLPSDLDDSQP
ncbi:MAG TPA: hypothetical protein VKV95_08755 [Terriglobia bacterium]|nr:hypothetical protein [Terriglobia bacterium]